MKLKVKIIRQGLHPNEVIVSIDTKEGQEERLVVHRRSLKNDALEVGYPIKEYEHDYLVELPRETLTGSWRVLVSKDKLVPSDPSNEAAA